MASYQVHPTDIVRYQSEVDSKLHHRDVVALALQKLEQELKTREDGRVWRGSTSFTRAS